MRCFYLILLVFVAHTSMGQVEHTTVLRFVGPAGDRTVTGMGDPLTENAAIIVEGSVLNTAHWSTATLTADTINLFVTPALTNYENGVLLQFVVPANIQGALKLRISGQMALPVLRPDGVPPVAGQMLSGSVCEVLFSGDRWILTNAPEKGCPPATTMVNERLCIETASTANMYFYPAVERCSARGGRLCKWSEYYVACIEHAAELTGLGAAWEWIDDSSNHANTAQQVGLANCEANRWADPQLITLGRTRCCFTPR